MSERNMEGEDSVRTVDCLRGRLLAERAASKNAKEEELQLENKLMELEKLLKQEAKSRNKAEKKLKFLMKKLESVKSSHCSDESEYISSNPCSIAKEEQELKEEKDLTDTQDCSVNLSDDSSTVVISCAIQFTGRIAEQRNDTFEDSLSSASEKGSSNVDQWGVSSSADEGIKQRNGLFEDSLSSASDQHSSLVTDQESGVCCHSFRSCADDSNSQVDDSMALVVVDTPQRKHRIDPVALDASVREVLDTLRRAKEELRSSMVRRRMKMMGVTVKTSTVFI
ncbi:hypothetical protein SASPL_138350 [Salvia splendens]|uniref:Uncharacterized protein n=1 Tax=Salvia splendens TaxID=180675 RepID=A0A8X8WWR4_SALSN|nr:uncharacterized protein LOC121764027 [Salvia splendens]KAG6401493.1 hypothetical protein SASPL_138350 [Salvia splendens]